AFSVQGHPHLPVKGTVQVREGSEREGESERERGRSPRLAVPLYLTDIHITELAWNCAPQPVLKVSHILLPCSASV
ncbi:hypothetical protein JZ751_001313, partial [Albula glossodonta]